MKYILILICICLTRFQTSFLLKINTKMRWANGKRLEQGWNTETSEKSIFIITFTLWQHKYCAKYSANTKRNTAIYLFMQRKILFEEIYAVKYTWTAINRGYTKRLTAWEKFSENFKMPKTKKKIKKHQKGSNRQNSNIVVAIICGITIIFAIFRLKERFIILPGLSRRF